ncbi:type II secretion system protein M [Tahibacter amnicola]|uniref:Type II secretion system protein M n=1 Tax=Tahibacter amnicola TaxID=2976241 RepID=A0ABY6BCM6_9GAMM|nr:type II secretion system protein M [Tahibacter amnicola]UXI67562.1 type II secretion system protein M [Tahibacter amnicola]
MIRQWWSQRDLREQRVLLVGGVATAVLLGWAMIWHPLSRSVGELKVRVAAQEADFEQMRSQAARVAQLRGQGARAKVDRQGKSLLALADATARGAQLANEMKRVEPVGPRTVRVSFEGASFDAIADWMEGLSRDFGVVVTGFSADRGEGAGRVNARVTLEEP